MFDKLKCFFGWHLWTWKFSRCGAVKLDGGIPSNAKCERCGTRYDKAEE